MMDGRREHAADDQLGVVDLVVDGPDLHPSRPDSRRVTVSGVGSRTWRVLAGGKSSEVFVEVLLEVFGGERW